MILTLVEVKMFAIKLGIFVFGTIGIVWVSRSSLQNINSHGFYRFFAWEIILIMFVLNMNYWIREPFSLHQIIAWTLLVISLILIVQGVQLFRQKGNIQVERSNPTLVGIEKTTQLVTSGIYRYIRHPFYSSLLFLAWGIAFKRIIWFEVILAITVTLFLIMTAKKEEVENIEFFGDEYRDYMKQTKMFIPIIF
jgi:protein-S-isoprenylcysteine O-methyltransferase Ste14